MTITLRQFQKRQNLLNLKVKSANPTANCAPELDFI